MRFAKEYPIFTAIIAVCLSIFVGGVVLDWLAASKAAKAEKSLARTEQRLKSLLTSSPALSEDNVKLTEENLADLQTQVDRRMAATKGKMPNFGSRSPVPASPSEMFFELEAYRKQFASDAERISAEVKAENDALKRPDAPLVLQIPENFAFGFLRYMEEPPEEKYIEGVHRQKEILTYVLRKLFNSKPHSIVAVKRQALIEKPTGRNQSQYEAMEDEFEINAQLSSAVEGAVEAYAYRFDFTGYTSSLRSFLTQLESFELPLVVRSVEVKPAKEVEQTAQATTTQQDAGFDSFFGQLESGDREAAEATLEENQEPVVQNNISEFSVILEYINVLSADFNIAQSDDSEDSEDDS